MIFFQLKSKSVSFFYLHVRLGVPFRFCVMFFCFFAPLFRLRVLRQLRFLPSLPVYLQFFVYHFISLTLSRSLVRLVFCMFVRFSICVYACLHSMCIRIAHNMALQAYTEDALTQCVQAHGKDIRTVCKISQVHTRRPTTSNFTRSGKEKARKWKRTI